MKGKHPSHDGYFKDNMSKDKIRQSIINFLPAEQVKHMALSKAVARLT